MWMVINPGAIEHWIQHNMTHGKKSHVDLIVPISEVRDVRRYVKETW